jgi:hypothetical protein
MATLKLTDDQVLDLVKQLPEEKQSAVFEYLLTRQWPTWVELSKEAQEGARKAAAERGKNWDSMSEEQREEFINDVVHEDRACRK